MNVFRGMSCRGGTLAAALTCCLFVGCSNQSRSTESPSDVRVEAAADASVITVADPSQVPVVTVSTHLFFGELKVNGVVAPDVNRTVPVLSLSGGRVLEVRARLGDEVKKGQVLMRIASNDISQAFADYQKFKTSEALSRRQLERAQELYTKGAIAQKELEMSEDAEQKAKVDLSTAAERLRVLGADVNRPSTVLEVRSPISGTVVEQNISPGTGVRSLDVSPNLFTVADLSRVWVLCDVYENNLSEVRIGDSGEVRLTAYPDKILKARISNIGRVLDPATRSSKVRLELANSGAILRPGMFATVSFRSQRGEDHAVVPSSALMRLHDKDWVFVALGGNKFRRTEVRAGALADGRQVVLNGVKAGDRVIANALGFLNGAEKEVEKGVGK